MHLGPGTSWKSGWVVFSSLFMAGHQSGSVCVKWNSVTCAVVKRQCLFMQDIHHWHQLWQAQRKNSLFDGAMPVWGLTINSAHFAGKRSFLTSRIDINFSIPVDNTHLLSVKDWNVINLQIIYGNLRYTCQRNIHVHPKSHSGLGLPTGQLSFCQGRSWWESPLNGM